MILEAIDEHDLEHPEPVRTLMAATLGPRTAGGLAGRQIQPGELADASYALGWTDAISLVTWVAVILSESQGFDRAFNDNLSPETGEVLSRDCGVGQVNIPAAKIGTDDEERLYDWNYNLVRCRALYETSTNATGGIRGFSPWYGWVLEVYLRDTYIKRAARGVGNHLATVLLERVPTDTLKGEPYVHSLVAPILDYRYRQQGMQQEFDAVVAKSRQLKPIGGAAVDAKADEIIAHAVAGKAWAQK